MAAEVADHHPDIRLTFGAVRVFLTSHDVGGITMRDVDLARQISALAADAGLPSTPAQLQRLELALDTWASAEIRPFWQAVLALDPSDQIPEELTDRIGDIPTVWF